MTRTVNTGNKKISDGKHVSVHIIGTLLVLSALFYSTEIYSLAAAIPVFFVSFGIYRDWDWVKVPALFAATICFSFILSTESMAEGIPLLIYSIIFVIPLASYWILILSLEIDLKIEWKGFFIGVSYLGLVLLLFYLVPSLLGISEFVLSPDNRAPQALLMVGFGLLSMVPYQIILEFKNLF